MASGSRSGISLKSSEFQRVNVVLASAVGASNEGQCRRAHREGEADFFWRSAMISCSRFFSMATPARAAWAIFCAIWVRSLVTIQGYSNKGFNRTILDSIKSMTYGVRESARSPRSGPFAADLRRSTWIEKSFTTEMRSRRRSKAADRSVRPTRHPLLRGECLDAVRQWRIGRGCFDCVIVRDADDHFAQPDRGWEFGRGRETPVELRSTARGDARGYIFCRGPAMGNLKTTATTATPARRRPG